MIYKVIGIMSGSSLDGLDIAYVQLEEVRGQWSYQIVQAECIEYADNWRSQLQHAATKLHVVEFLKLHTAYGHYLGDRVNEFIARHDLAHKVHFIASHGHTVFHEPQNHTTWQLGDGAALAAVTGLPVINDLRAADVALGGQGAPIVPIGDRLLFSNYDYLLNIGGIANITIQKQQPLAFDVCPANQVLNILAQREGRTMDESGAMAARGVLLPEIIDELNEVTYYKMPPPKSLSNEAAIDLVFPKLSLTTNSTYDLLHTVSQHIAMQVAAAVEAHPHGKDQATMLVTGGGAFNTFLVQQIGEALNKCGVAVTVPGPDVVKFKEALVMALIGTLRWREEINVLSSVTGATHDSVGGALWKLTA